MNDAKTIAALGLAALLAGCATTGAAPVAEAKPVKELRPGILEGYLPLGGAPSSLAIVPPAPATGSATQARDDEAAKAAVAQIGGARWKQAAEDAVLKFPEAAGTFSCAVGAPISEAETPRLYRLLHRTLTDVGFSTYPTKTKYQRPRPFMVNGAPTCSPGDEPELRKDGSYPSGHSAIGWGWGLILAEAAPDRAAEILARGRAFGQSRVACNVHWLSDTEEGRMMAAATVARLHADATFEADLAAARDEIAAARAKGLAPSRDCAKEAAQLAGQ